MAGANALCTRAHRRPCMRDDFFEEKSWEIKTNYSTCTNKKQIWRKITFRDLQQMSSFQAKWPPDGPGPSQKLTKYLGLGTGPGAHKGPTR